MSTRALRRAQRELEERQQLERAAAEEEDDELEEEQLARPTKTSLFAMLDEGSEEEEQEQDDDDGADEKPESMKAIPNHEQSDDPATERPQQKSSKASKKKRKRKGKGKAPTKQDSPQLPVTSTSDEIDLALRSLSMRTKSEESGAEAAKINNDPGLAEVFKVLSVDSTHLHATNEMRKLFGRAALEEDHGAPEPAGGRRRGRGQQQVGLAGVVAGRNMPGGRGLAGLGLRRNVFIQGKEEWPKATSGGLGMELVEKRADGTVEYRFIHNKAYQDVQRQFDSCVASMDPNRMVSEIAKQERDHATSGDLLERALFNFGRCVHSSFSNSLAQGKARLDFRRPENREFWLAAWRYIGNLGMRSTWRTALEWAKLLLSLDPEHDPYCVRLVIDQFALRARQPQQLIDLVKSEYFESRWEGLPNIALSVGLAYVQAKDPSVGREKLDQAMAKYPWVAARLFQELDLEPIPPRIWGKAPGTPYEKLLTELYVVRAKDIWNTPEGTSLLYEIASRPTPATTPSSAPSPDGVKRTKLDVGRHTILTDNPALISLLDRGITALLTSVSDPLPPPDNLPSYNTATAQAPRPIPDNPAEVLREYTSLESFFRSLFPWFDSPGGAGVNPETGVLATPEDLERRILDAGIPEELIIERTDRLQALQQAIEDMGIARRVRPGENGDGNEDEVEVEFREEGDESDADEAV